MDIITCAVVAILMVIVSVKLSKINPEYGLYLSIGTCVFIIFFSIDKVREIIDFVDKMTALVQVDIAYIQVIIKMIAIAYVCQWTSGICKDAGHSAIGTQIEIAGKLAMLVTSIPILTNVVSMIEELFE